MYFVFSAFFVVFYFNWAFKTNYVDRNRSIQYNLLIPASSVKEIST